MKRKKEKRKNRNNIKNNKKIRINYFYYQIKKNQINKK